MANDSIFPIEKMCKVLRVSRSSYYSWLTRDPSKRSVENRPSFEVVREGRILKEIKLHVFFIGNKPVLVLKLIEGLIVNQSFKKSLTKNESQ